jgi:hypothetical protein
MEIVMISRNATRQGECCIPTFSGRSLDLLAPAATQIDIEDIAHGLAYQSCFNGQTSHFYSLAQHSLLVASLVPLPQRLGALLHDAAAAYLGGIAPAMRSLIPGWAAIEGKVSTVISEQFGLSAGPAPAIKRAQQIAMATEQRDVCPALRLIRGEGGRVAPLPRRIEFMTPAEARYQFKALFAELSGKLAGWSSLHAVPSAKQADASQPLKAQGNVVLAHSRPPPSLMSLDGSFKQGARTAIGL